MNAMSSKTSPETNSQVSLIRKELLSLTGNHTHAVILNQLLYWTQRTKDFSLMLEEERKAAGKTVKIEEKEEYKVEESIPPQHGWIYKTADDLVEETMLRIDRTTLRRHLARLVRQEWLFERSNPRNKWDRTTQYRINVQKIQQDLLMLGHDLFVLSLWKLEELLLDALPPEPPILSNKEDLSKTAEISNGRFAHSNEQVAPSNGHDSSKTAETSNGHFAHSNEQVALSNGDDLPKTPENPNGHFAHSNEQVAPSNGQDSSKTAETSNGHFAHSNEQVVRSNGHDLPKTAENPNGRFAHSNGQNAHSNGQIARCNTEIITENIYREKHRAGARTGVHVDAHTYARVVADSDTTTDARFDEEPEEAFQEERKREGDCEIPCDSSFGEEQKRSTAALGKARVAALMVDLWRRYVNPEVISLTDERKHRLESLLELHFQADLRVWESFCLRVKASPFLMGGGSRKWHVTLDWVLAKGNLLKVLEGNYDGSGRMEHQKNEPSKGVQDREIRALLDSIQDSFWKNWCSQMMGIHPITGGPLMDGDQPIEAVLTVYELKQITEARFMEFDGRLVWIECFDEKTLSKIEDLRFKISPVARATFPEARAVRGHLHQPQFSQ